MKHVRGAFVRPELHVIPVAPPHVLAFVEQVVEGVRPVRIDAERLEIELDEPRLGEPVVQIHDSQDNVGSVAGGLGEADRGGPAFNLVPKTGGNNFSGTYFGNLAGEWSQGDNVDDELKSFGIPTPAAIIRSWDTSFALSGPIKRDKVWFYSVARTFGAYTDIAGRFANANAGNPNLWEYVSDLSVTQRSAVRSVVAGM